MTDDLVKRLRDGPCVDSIDTWDMLQQGADRIEQLQAALYDMMQLLPRAEWYYLKPETRAALGEKKDD
jgi:hypothetical protein